MWERLQLPPDSPRTPIEAPAQLLAEPAGNRICCGEPMEPRLVQARDRDGQTTFVAVWRCSRCGRTVA